MSNFLYQIEDDKIFHIQNNDIFLIEKKFRLSFFLKPVYFLIFSIIAFGSIPFAKEINLFFGLPFIHIFSAVFSIPINMMAFAFLTRAWLVFFYLPKRLNFKKDVYVDMDTKNKIKNIVKP